MAYIDIVSHRLIRGTDKNQEIPQPFPPVGTQPDIFIIYSIKAWHSLPTGEQGANVNQKVASIFMWQGWAIMLVGLYTCVPNCPTHFGFSRNLINPFLLLYENIEAYNSLVY